MQQEMVGQSASANVGRHFYCSTSRLLAYGRTELIALRVNLTLLALLSLLLVADP
jgi:hypothetical protein